MKRITRSVRPSPALIVGIVALFAAMSGAAIAADMITSSEIKNRTIKGRDVGLDALKGRHIKEGKLKDQHIKDGSLTGTELKDDSVTNKQVDEGTLELPHVPVAFTERATATEAATGPAAQAAAPKVPLATKGALSLYGRCFRDTTTDETFGRVYIETSANGAIFESRSTGDSFDGGPTPADFLNVNTAEDDREVDVNVASGNAASVQYSDEEPFFAMAPDEPAIHGLVEVAVKAGNLAGGNGVYGDGHVCLFTGNVIG